MERVGGVSVCYGQSTDVCNQIIANGLLEMGGRGIDVGEINCSVPVEPRYCPSEMNRIFKNQCAGRSSENDLERIRTIDLKGGSCVYLKHSCSG